MAVIIVFYNVSSYDSGCAFQICAPSYVADSFLYWLQSRCLSLWIVYYKSITFKKCNFVTWLSSLTSTKTAPQYIHKPDLWICQKIKFWCSHALSHKYKFDITLWLIWISQARILHCNHFLWCCLTISPFVRMKFEYII